MKDEEILSFNERRDLAIEAGMQLIPYVGSSLSVIYFGSKQERKFKRIESFYKEIAVEIERIKERIAALDKQDKDSLEAILESLHERIESELISEKIRFFKNYFLNTLCFPVTANFDERRRFLDSLAESSFLECDLLLLLKTRGSPTRVGDLRKPGVNQYAIVGAVSRIKSRGFLISSQAYFTIGVASDNSLEEMVSLSSFGLSFVEFCLEQKA